MNVKELAEQYRNEIIAWRRDFHAHPELALEEFETADKVARELEKLGIKVTRVGKTGVLGTLTGNHPGKTVALRADMDALAIVETTGVSYQSKNAGVMHACGHDGHTAMLLGAAKILSQLKDEIRGTIKFIFQPAEEVGLGALQFLEAGILEGVSAVFGAHLWPDIPTGKVSLEAGPRMASVAKIKITVKGASVHGSMPNLGVDAIVAAAAIVMNLQTISSREISPLEPVVVSIGKFAGGTSWNILCDEVVMEGTTRSFSRETKNKLCEMIERVARNTAASLRAEAHVEYAETAPPTINDPHVSKIAAGALKKLYGEGAAVEAPKVMGGEDFAYLMEAVPGAFALIGSGNKEKETSLPLHQGKFNIDEDALPIGAALHAQFALDFLAQEN